MDSAGGVDGEGADEFGVDEDVCSVAGDDGEGVAAVVSGAEADDEFLAGADGSALDEAGVGAGRRGLDAFEGTVGGA